MPSAMSELAPRVRWQLAWIAAGLALLFAATGLTGHDPWKQDEAYSFGIILNMVESGDWLIPRLANDPFMEKPPVYYWTAAGLVTLLGERLPAHDAARLATGFYLLLTMAFLAAAARAVWNPPAGALAVLVWIGTLVVIQQGHYLITDTALAAGMALGLWGLVLATRRWLAGGLALATGAGLSFMAKGLLGPGMLGVTALALLLLPAWRCRAYWQALLVAMLAAAPWVLIWPVLLYLRDPALFQQWFWDNNFGRYLGGVGLGEQAEADFWLRTFPWATFPAAPLALWALWARRAELARNLGVQATLAVSLVGWSVLFAADTARDLYALPLIAPLAVIAAGGLSRLPAWSRSLGFWISVALFGVLGLLLWYLWLHGLMAGEAPHWPVLARQLPLLHDFHRVALSVVAAVVLTVLWIVLARWVRPPRQGALLVWPAGVVLMWALVAQLHFPWIDQAKSYRAVFAELKAVLPAGHGCVSDLSEPETLRLRESERALLHYFAGVKIVHASSPERIGCDLALLEVQRRIHPQGISLGSDWKLLWQGSRPTDRRDAFMLFARITPTDSSQSDSAGAL